MATLYFLAFIAVCALAFVWLVSRSNRAKTRSKKPGNAAHRHTEPLYRHTTAHHPVAHSHTGNLPSQTHDMWHTRRPHATKEHWVKSGMLTANRIHSDDEVAQEADEDMTMTTIEYVPEQVKGAGSKG